MPNSRERKDGYAVTERTAGLADLLFLIVTRLDCGASPTDLAGEVKAIGQAMTGTGCNVLVAEK